MIKSCYIHVPFCKNICSYCDFCKNYHNKKIVKSYLGSLEKEIKKNYKNNVLNTLYIGGGTPSCLITDEIKALFKILNIFKLSKDYEFTFECNYEDITEELLIFLKNNKVNRISIGIQTFNNKFSYVLNRRINANEMIEKIELSKKYFDNINIDLMYALPLQTLNDLKNDLDIVIKLNINHISIYSLIIEEHTVLKTKAVKEVNEDMQNKMYYMICDHLKKHGYYHYEISNFSKKNYESKHNLNYWNNDNYYGFGAGASGFIEHIRYDNTKSISNYINQKQRIHVEKIDFLQMIKDEVMLSLRKINGINKEKFMSKYKIDFHSAFSINDIKARGLLIENDKYIYIPYKYLFVSNLIILEVISSCLLE